AGQNPELTLEHRDVEELPSSRLLPRVQRREDTERGVHPRRDVRDRHPRTDAASAWLAGDAHHPALGLHDEVECGAIAIRSVLPEAGDRAVDDAGPALARTLVVDAEPGDGADPQVLEHDVGAIEQPEEQRLP